MFAFTGEKVLVLEKPPSLFDVGIVQVVRSIASRDFVTRLKVLDAADHQEAFLK